jgi:hypothetical protein
LPAEVWRSVPRSELWRFFVIPGHPEFEYVVQAIAVLALCCAALGVTARVACFVSALLLYHLAPLETLYWTANPFQRGFTVSVLALFTLSFSRCADALRLGGAPEVAPSASYCWPLRLLQLHLAEVYFFSGTSKLYRVGLAWLEPENLRSWFLLFYQQDQVRRDSPIFSTLGPWIADHWLLCFVAALFGVLANLLFITTPFSKVARRILVPDAVFFHVMVLLTLNIFWNNIVQLLIFVNWHWLVGRISARSGHPTGEGNVRAERHT